MRGAESNLNFLWWFNDPPVANLSGDYFSVRGTGKIQPRFTQTYTLYTISDDGVRLWVDGQLLIDHWAEHGPTEDAWTIDLVPASNTTS